MRTVVAAYDIARGKTCGVDRKPSCTRHFSTDLAHCAATSGHEVTRRAAERQGIAREVSIEEDQQHEAPDGRNDRSEDADQPEAMRGRLTGRFEQMIQGIVGLHLTIRFAKKILISIFRLE